MQTSVTKNTGLGFTDEQWGQLIDGNGLLIMWFIEWNQKVKNNKRWGDDLSIQEFFTQKYNQSAGCNPWPIKGAVSLDGKFVSTHEDDDDLEPYFMIDTDDGVGYIYPYAFVALPTKAGGHTIVRMD